MKLESTFLRSKVARRIFVLFILCTLLPIGAVTLLSFQSVSGQLTQQSRRQLQRVSKSEGMEAYERLENLEAEMRLAAHGTGPGHAASVGQTFKVRFQNAAHLNLQGQVKDVIFGMAPALPPLNPLQLQHLRAGGSLVTVGPCVEGGKYCPSIVRMVDPGKPESGVLIAEIRPDFLWDDNRLPDGTELCVYASGRALTCETNAALEDALGKLGPEQDEDGRFFTWKESGVSFDSAYWDLFLNARFVAPDWTFVLTEQHSDVLAPMQRFRTTFPFLILLALLIVVLLSSIQIRRTLGPLEKLTEATEQIADQHFETRVNVHSGDEFEYLAGSFNAMTSRLGNQFHALRILSEIDQAVLASLNREDIIAAVLQHMPDLFPYSCFAIALLDDARIEGHASMTLTIPGRKLHRRLTEVRFTAEELAYMQDCKTGCRISSQDATPEFLAPLVAEGMKTFWAIPILVSGKPYGAVVCADASPLEPSEQNLEHLRQITTQLSVAFSNAELVESMKQLHWGALSALARAIDAKSTWTAGHSERVTLFALKLARAMGLPQKDLEIMNRGGLLHDIGKIGTPPEVLDKPGRLDPKELETMREHVRIGMRILEPIPGMTEALPIVAQHHEWFDGNGYPDGLKGEQISLHARIFAVADCYDALVSDRPYRAGLPLQKVVEIINSGSGKQFDPRVIEVFLRVCAEEGSSTPEANSLAFAAGQS